MLGVLHKLHKFNGNYVSGYYYFHFSGKKKLILNTLYKSPNINFVVISRAGLEPKAE